MTILYPNLCYNQVCFKGTALHQYLVPLLHFTTLIDVELTTIFSGYQVRQNISTYILQATLTTGSILKR